MMVDGIARREKAAVPCGQRFWSKAHASYGIGFCAML
jgi:hypothetical protein